MDKVNGFPVVNLGSIYRRLLVNRDQDDGVHGLRLPSPGDRGSCTHCLSAHHKLRFVHRPHEVVRSWRSRAESLLGPRYLEPRGGRRSGASRLRGSGGPLLTLVDPPRLAVPSREVLLDAVLPSGLTPLAIRRLGVYSRDQPRSRPATEHLGVRVERHMRLGRGATILRSLVAPDASSE